MISYIALMVGKDSDNTVTYGQVEIISTVDKLPENNVKDIRNIVRMANEHPDTETEFIDVYGYSYLGNKVLWEVQGTEEEGGGLHYDT